MIFSKRNKLTFDIIISLFLFFAILFGILFGIAIASTKNLEIHENIGEFKPALPSQILDINGELITEFFSEEKRDIVPVDELPKHLVYALLSREDSTFFTHNGFSILGTMRAAWNILTGQYFSGGSTITQQVAGKLYANRDDRSVKRKLVELWWALQLERSLTKKQILELYLNEVYFGHNTYGVEAASQFYFGHSARDISIAESALLVIQLASPAKYSPIKHPNRAKKIQYEVLKSMVKLGYCTQEEVDLSYDEYWNDIYDPTRSGSETAYLVKDDKAPYFSEYVRQELEKELFGTLDYFRDGLIVHTTLDLNYQKTADEIMDEAFKKINMRYHENTNVRISYVEKEFVPLIDILSLSFDITNIRVSGSNEIKLANKVFNKTLNPSINILSMMLGSSDLKYLSNISYARQYKESRKTVVEGALVTLEHDTGYIKAMIGGSDFETKKLNRAVQSKIMPGSSFKPLYYSAAISSRTFTPASLIYDAPVVFWNEDGTEYTPLNFMGEWKGPVTLRYALAKSMNVPSIQVLDAIGFDAAIERASRLLGIDDPVEISKTFPRKYPLGLGIVSVAPIQMARAFSTFPNQGKEVNPLAIRYIEDRSGKVILEPERKLRSYQQKMGDSLHILDPASSYIMVDLLQSTVNFGTLANRRRQVGGFDGMPMAGKTGTTQNWSDAWTVGFSPYVTTAVWFGFDMPGNSLGLNQTGATAAGPVWAKYMKEIHRDLPPKDFIKPDAGLVETTVCSTSGQLPTEYCDKTRKEIFLASTEPRKPCHIHKFEKERDEELLLRLQRNLLTEDFIIEEDDIFSIDSQDLLKDIQNNISDVNSAEITNPLLD